MRDKRIYRRGDLIWWRLGFRLHDGRDVLVRLSLRTSDSAVARRKACLLEAAIDGVKCLVEDAVRRNSFLTPAQLQQIARAGFDDALATIASYDLRYPNAGPARTIFIRNQADTANRISRKLGQLTQLDDTEASQLQRAGWDDNRINHLRVALSIIAHGGKRHFRAPEKELASLLEQFDVEPTEATARSASLAWIRGADDALSELLRHSPPAPTFDETLEATDGRFFGLPSQDHWLASSERIEFGSYMATSTGTPKRNVKGADKVAVASSHSESRSVSEERHPHQDRDSDQQIPPRLLDSEVTVSGQEASDRHASGYLTLADATEMCVAQNSAVDGWSPATCKQIRAAMEMLIFVTAKDYCIEDLTQRDLGRLADLFSILPNRRGNTSEEREEGLAASVRRGKLLADSDPEALGISQKTQNKHWTWVSQVLKWAAIRGHKPSEALDFEGLRRGVGKKARKDKQKLNSLRAAWKPDEVKRLLEAPIWFGSAGLFDRFTPGSHVWHDAWYWAPLMVMFYGGRSSELVALQLSEFDIDAEIPYFRIEFSELRSLKNVQSIRNLPIHPELIRLGFLDYIKALSSLGQTVLFPEMHSPMSESYASTFYKSIFKEWRDFAFPEGTPWRHRQRGAWKDKDAHSFRGFVSTRLKGQVSDSIRFELLGHEGTNTTTIVYDEEAPMHVKRDALASLSDLTRHLPRFDLRMRPAEFLRHGKPRGRRSLKQETETF